MAIKEGFTYKNVERYALHLNARRGDFTTFTIDLHSRYQVEIEKIYADCDYAESKIYNSNLEYLGTYDLNRTSLHWFITYKYLVQQGRALTVNEKVEDTKDNHEGMIQGYDGQWRWF